MRLPELPAGRPVALLLIAGALLLFIPYTLLTVYFDYPDILREPAGTVLARFHAGGPPLIWIWWSFAMSGLPLLPAFIRMGQLHESASPWTRTAMVLGIIAGILQVAGLLRWVFVVPVLARAYAESDSEAVRAAAEIAFQALHQFGGVILGEHLGQLFTILWTVLMAWIFRQGRIFPAWLSYAAYAVSAIYLMAQAELFATVIPGFPVWEPAGFIGSTLWLLWLIVLGGLYWRKTADSLA
ncbi:MAG: DUF4386 domain-containing protein [Bacteroidia bacterium]|nr:DUF4386 domain-containing protein [Bacteroidia bacterium]